MGTNAQILMLPRTFFSSQKIDLTSSWKFDLFLLVLYFVSNLNLVIDNLTLPCSCLVHWYIHPFLLVVFHFSLFPLSKVEVKNVQLVLNVFAKWSLCVISRLEAQWINLLGLLAIQRGIKMKSFLMLCLDLSFLVKQTMAPS